MTIFPYFIGMFEVFSTNFGFGLFSRDLASYLGLIIRDHGEDYRKKRGKFSGGQERE